MSNRHIPVAASLLIVAFAISCWPHRAIADEPNGAALLVKNRCIACHDVSRTLLGPPYITIAARHASQRGLMIEVLAQKIISGGAGNWGVVPMVPNEHVSLDEARAMSRWILSLHQSSE